MTTTQRYEITAIANCCGYTGTLAAIELHDCAIAENGGRCEDYPACGHTDGDGCQTLPEHTAAYWLDHPHLLLDEDDPYDSASYGEWLDEVDWDER